MEEGFHTTMNNDDTREYHFKGTKSGLNDYQIYYRKRIHSSERDTGGCDMCSDEFLNDYIPDPSKIKFVQWKDVIACGMIPEIRTNPHIREDIQFSKIQIEAPSPAPAPAPAPSVIHAEPISPEFIKECNYISDTINLKITNTMTNINYIHKIHSEDELWEKNSKYFPDFHKFYNILNSSLNNDNEYVQSKIESDNDNLRVILTHEGLYSFEIEIIVPKEKDRIDVMEEKIENLITENIYLKDQNEKIMKIIREHSNWANDDFDEYLWLVLDKMSINNNINDTTTPFSGELVDEKKMKNRMLCNNYWACYVAENGICYYSGVTLHWRHCISLLRLTRSYSKHKLYIRIPKQDIDSGIGDMNVYPDHEIKHHSRYKKGINNFHGHPEHSCGTPTSTTTNKFIIRYGSFKYQDWEKAGSGANGEADKWKNSPCNNIHIPVEYYCTNCNCIESKIFSKEGEPKEGWEVYECQGH